MITDSSDRQNPRQPGMIKEKLQVAPSPLPLLEPGARMVPRMGEHARTRFANRPY